MTSTYNHTLLKSRTIVDTHVHFLNKEKLTYPWMESVPLELQKTLEPDEYWQEAKLADILPSHSHKCVAVEADCAFSKDRPFAELSFLESLNNTDDNNQLIGGIVAFLPMEEGPEVIEPLLRKLVQNKNVKGIRRMFQHEVDNPDFIIQPKLVNSIRLLANYNLTFDLCVLQDQLPDLIHLVQACPDVAFVLDHMGKPAIRSSTSGTMNKTWAKNISKLATFPNVEAVKISGVITEANLDCWTREDIEPYICHVVKAFGVNRCMFGSDWPILRIAGNYERWVSVLTDILLENELLKTDKDMDKFFSGNARRIYQI